MNIHEFCKRVSELDNASRDLQSDDLAVPTGAGEALIKAVVDVLVSMEEDRRRRILSTDDEDDSDTCRNMSIIPRKERVKAMLKECIGVLYSSNGHRSAEGSNNWPLAVPALIGHILGFIGNHELASVLEIIREFTSLELCALLGYKVEPGNPDHSFAKVGTFATAPEGVLGMYRLAKYLPFSVRIFLTKNEKFGNASLEGARKITVTTVSGERVPIVDATSWDLMNLPLEAALQLPSQVSKATKIDASVIESAIMDYSITSLGMIEMQEYVSLHDNTTSRGSPLLLVSSAGNDEWAKAYGRIGMGSNTVVSVEVDQLGRISCEAISKHLERAIQSKTPVMAIIVNVGSTVFGIVDQIEEVEALRQKYRKKGLDFRIHVDASMGGLWVSSIRKVFDVGDVAGKGLVHKAFDKIIPGLSDDPFISDARHIPLPDYTITQLKQMVSCDSVNFGLADIGASVMVTTYGNGGFKMLIPDSQNGASEPSDKTIASDYYGAFLALRFNGMGGLFGIGRVMSLHAFEIRSLLVQLNYLNENNETYECVPLNTLPPKWNGDDMSLPNLRKYFTKEPNYDRVQRNGKHLTYLRSMGPDLDVTLFTFNPKNAKNGKPNTNWEIFEKLNEAVWEAYHLHIQAATETALQLTPIHWTLDRHGVDLINSVADRCHLNSLTAPGKEIRKLSGFAGTISLGRAAVDHELASQLKVDIEAIDSIVREKAQSFKIKE